MSVHFSDKEDRCRFLRLVRAPGVACVGGKSILSVAFSCSGIYDAVSMCFFVVVHFNTLLNLIIAKFRSYKFSYTRFDVLN